MGKKGTFFNSLHSTSNRSDRHLEAALRTRLPALLTPLAQRRTQIQAQEREDVLGREECERAQRTVHLGTAQGGVDTGTETASGLRDSEMSTDAAPWEAPETRATGEEAAGFHP